MQVLAEVETGTGAQAMDMCSFLYTILDSRTNQNQKILTDLLQLPIYFS